MYMFLIFFLFYTQYFAEIFCGHLSVRPDRPQSEHTLVKTVAMELYSV